jgi:hypothetical protein
VGVSFNNRPPDRTKQIAILRAWQVEVVPRVCEECGDQFKGIRQKRFCDTCSKERKKQQDRNYDAKRLGQRKEARRKAKLERLEKKVHGTPQA